MIIFTLLHIALLHAADTLPNLTGVAAVDTAAAVPVYMPLLDKTISVLNSYTKYDRHYCSNLIQQLRILRENYPSEFICLFLSHELRTAFTPHIVAGGQGEELHIIRFAEFVARNMNKAATMSVNSQPTEVLIIGGPRPARRHDRRQREGQAPLHNVRSFAANNNDGGHIMVQPTPALEFVSTQTATTLLAQAVQRPPEAPILNTTANLNAADTVIGSDAEVDEDAASVGLFCGCC
ncbi:MAG: hypothetical protein AAB323_00915 [Pseudomonadota bacterium]